MVVRFLLLSEAFAVATFAVGWLGVPIVAIIWGLMSERRSNPARWATVCAMAGWLELLLLDAARGPVGEVASLLGGVMGLPSFVLFAITLLFPALLAWSAASVAEAIRGAASAYRSRSSAAPARSPQVATTAEVAVVDG